MKDTNRICAMRSKVLTLLAIMVTTLSAQNISVASFKLSERIGNNSRVFPSWMSGVANNALWLGVSPPTQDIVVARNLAIQNAVLYYFCANGGGLIYSVYTSSYESLDDKDFSNSTSISKEDVAVVFDKFSVRVQNEYYNKRGEYFVACYLEQNDDSENLMQVSRIWDDRNELKHYYPMGIEGVLNGNIQCEVVSRIDGVETESTLKVTYGNEGLSSAVTSEGVVFAESQDFKYPKSQIAILQDTCGYKLTVEQSLGVAQMTCLAMSPFITDEVTRNRMVYAEGEGERSKITSNLYLSAKGKSKGLRTILYKINKNILGVAISDDSAEMRNWDFSDDKRFWFGEGFSDTRNNRPLALAKLKAYYNALEMVPEQSAMISASEKFYSGASSNTSGISSFQSKSEENISNYYVDWCYDRKSEYGDVQISLIVDLQARKAALEEHLKDTSNVASENFEGLLKETLNK